MSIVSKAKMNVNKVVIALVFLAMLLAGCMEDPLKKHMPPACVDYWGAEGNVRVCYLTPALP